MLTDDDPLARLLAYQTTPLIAVVISLGVPERLAAGPQSAEALAAATGAHAPSLGRVLRALAAHGLVGEDAAGRFALTDAGQRLRPDVPGSVAPFAASYAEPWWWNAWAALGHSVRTGEPAFDHVHGCGLFEFLDRDPDARARFHANMSATTAAQTPAVVAALDLDDARQVVDVGAGYGALTAALLTAHPALRATLVDRHETIAGARVALAGAGVLDRCTLVTGDLFGTLPAAGDLYLLKDILHDWDDQRAIAILRGCRAAIAATGRLVVIERLLDRPDQAASAALVDVTMLVMTGGRERTGAEYGALLAAAGFDRPRVTHTTGTASLIEARPA